jgi:hypothetical protein
MISFVEGSWVDSERENGLRITIPGKAKEEATSDDIGDSVMGSI